VYELENHVRIKNSFSLLTLYTFNSEFELNIFLEIILVPTLLLYKQKRSGAHNHLSDEMNNLNTMQKRLIETYDTYKSFGLLDSKYKFSLQIES
jgi:hypothetical protein